MDLDQSEFKKQLKSEEHADAESKRSSDGVTTATSSTSAVNVLSTECYKKSDVEDNMDDVKEPPVKRVKLDEPPQLSLDDDIQPDEKVNISAAAAARIKEKEETLRRLKMVEMYKNKWSIEELRNQTTVWKELANTTFEDLYKKSCSEQGTLTKEELLKYLSVDPSLLDLNFESSQ